MRNAVRLGLLYVAICDCVYRITRANRWDFSRLFGSHLEHAHANVRKPTQMYTNPRKYMHAHTNVRKPTQIHACPHKCTQTHANVYKPTQIHACPRKCTQTHSNVYKPTQIHACPRKCTQTHSKIVYWLDWSYFFALINNVCVSQNHDHFFQTSIKNDY